MIGMSYKELIKKTFCDSAIRSVIMIDDDFLPYDELARNAAENRALSEKHVAGTLKAANIHEFFQMQKVTCDVDSGTSNLDVDRIRKCDLVILDYHLEFENPARSIKLIRELRKNPHMNLLVVYTSEDLDRTWLQICASLRGGQTVDLLFEENAEGRTVWDQLTDDGAGVPDELREEMSVEELEYYLLHGQTSGPLRKRFGPTYGKQAGAVATAVCEDELRRLNIVGAVRDEQAIYGSSRGIKWLQSGNIFIALHRKTNAGNDAPGIWDTLTKAVEDWSPTYYQLLVSEVQNWMESEPLPFDADGFNDVEGQAAWLSAILQETCEIKRETMIENLIDRLTEELKNKLLSSAPIKEFAHQTLAYLANDALTRDPKDFDIYSASHLKIKMGDTDGERLGVKQKMFHSLNTSLCSRSFTGDYVTNGSVLYDERAEKFYLCVSPACDAVPEQRTSPLAVRLAPHRFMKLLALESCNLESALSEAVFGRHIFVKSGENRKALIVQNSRSHNPSVDYVLVHNHSSRDKNIVTDGVNVSFLSLGEGDKFLPLIANLKPIAQLRDSYTARYQTVASHHSGRVGVDYISFPTKTEPT